MKSKKMTGYGKGGAKKKAAKPMATSVYKKGGAKKKKLKKYQTAGPKTQEEASFYDRVGNVNFAPFKSVGDKFQTEREQLDSVDKQIIDSMMQNKAANRNASIMDPTQDQMMLKGERMSPYYRGGGSITNAKALRNYSRGGARKNR